MVVDRDILWKYLYEGLNVVLKCNFHTLYLHVLRINKFKKCYLLVQNQNTNFKIVILYNFLRGGRSNVFGLTRVELHCP
jgi:hypothetical protein